VSKYPRTTKPNRSLHAVSVTYGWQKGIQVISSKAASGNITAPNAELEAIRLRIPKDSSLDVDRISVITDFLSSKSALDLRPFFNRNSNNKVEFWDCSSKEKWHLDVRVDDDAKSTIMFSTPSQFFSLDVIGEKPNRSTVGHNKSHQFLELRVNKKKCIRPPHIKGGGMGETS